MKIILSSFFLLLSTFVVAQNRRGNVYNKDLRVMIGNWAGYVIYTDPLRNDAQFNLKTKLTVYDLKDSIAFKFVYEYPDGTITTDSTTVCIYEAIDTLTYDGRNYKITSTVRKGPSLSVEGESQRFFGDRFADIRRTIIFSPRTISITKDRRFMENEYYSNLYRSTLNRIN